MTNDEWFDENFPEKNHRKLTGLTKDYQSEFAINVVFAPTPVFKSREEMIRWNLSPPEGKIKRVRIPRK
ncbi:MAG: hypothetical protein ACREHG_10465 [Candidatus Saccharimonadales bacterium]